MWVIYHSAGRRRAESMRIPPRSRRVIPRHPRNLTGGTPIALPYLVSVQAEQDPRRENDGWDDR